MSVLGLCICLALVGLAMLIFMRRAGNAIRRHEKEIAASRSSDTLESFVMSFRPEVQSIASTLSAEFQKFTHSGKFPFRKSDRVAELLNIGKSDLDEALERVADQFGCRKPSKQDDSKFRGRETFEDYVEFIHHLKATEQRVERSEVV